MRIIRKSFVLVISLAGFIFLAPFGLMRGIWRGLFPSGEKDTSFDLVQKAYAVVLVTVEEALKSGFPGADKIKVEKRSLTDEQKKTVIKNTGGKFRSSLDREYNFFIGISDEKITGYALKNSVQGKWGPIDHMVFLDTDGSVRDVIVLEYKEVRGRAITKKSFLKQFIGKTAGDKIAINRDIRKVSGATVSSRSMALGIKRSVHIFKELYGKEQ